MLRTPKLALATLLGFLFVGLVGVCAGAQEAKAKQDEAAGSSKPAATASAKADTSADSAADDSEPDEGSKQGSGDAEKRLEEKGLSRSKRLFLLDEKPALAQFHETRKAYEDLEEAMARAMTIQQFDANLAEMNAQAQMLQQQATLVQQQISRSSAGAGRYARAINATLAPLRAQQTQLRNQANQLRNQANAVKANGPKPADRQAAEVALTRARASYADSARELADQVNPLMAQYYELNHDKSLVKAFEDLRHETGRNYRLGPSDEIKAAVKVLKDLKLSIDPAKKTSKKTSKKPAGTDDFHF